MQQKKGNLIFLSFIISRDIGSDSMKIDNNTLNEIRNNLDIVEIISNYLPLTSKGKN